MKLSYNWLKQKINHLPKPEKLVDLINTRIANVEEIIKPGKGLENILVAEVKELKKHPNADKLQLVDVKTKINEKDIELRLVCGAFNIKRQDKVPLALPGSKIADGTMIKAQTIRGEKSKGMLCAEDELGIGSDHSGIMILNKDTKIGEKVSKVLGLNDIILDVENKSITNRPDLFNHIGFAREISAALGKELDYNYPTYKDNKKELDVRVEIKTKDCLRYMALVLDNVTVKESPFWMKSFLRSNGLEPINNIVDITNYVLLEIGQPLHAFDRDKIKEDKIIVRKAKKGEALSGLDNKKHKLEPSDTVIADQNNPIALAGVVGGRPTSINNNTKRIVIESACFSPVSTRKTSRRLDTRTESAIRFEKGLPLKFTEYGIYRAIELLRDLAGAQVKTKIIDIKDKKVTENKKIKLDLNKLKDFVGADISDKKIKNILKYLGCKLESKNNYLLVLPPLWRNDLNIFEDLVEEVVRIYGLEKIKDKPIKANLKPKILSDQKKLNKKIKNILIGSGFDEVINYSFYSKEDHKKSINDFKEIELKNPVSSKNYILRTSLLPLLFKNVDYNKGYFNEFNIFEIGNIFYNKNGKNIEKKKIAGLVKTDKKAFFKAKAGLEVLFNRLHINYSLKKDYDHIAKVFVNNKEIGFCGQKNNLGFFEIDFNHLFKAYNANQSYKKISPYPIFKRDLAFLVDKSINWGDIKNDVMSVSNLIQDVILFDLFEGKKLGNKRNLAFHIVYQSSKKTLKSEKIDEIQKKIIKKVENKFNAKLRDF